jgi:hypothetical protein
MWKRIAIGLALLGGWCSAANAQSNIIGSGIIGDVKVSGGGGGYTGPGDVVSGAFAWWGLRAYSSATTGTKAAHICNAGDANCADINTLSNGNFDVTTAQGAPLNCGGTGGTCTVSILYDQTGNGHDVNKTAIIAERPTLVFSCLGSLPCMNFVTGSSQHLNTPGNFTVAQPYTFSYTCMLPSNPAATQGVVGVSAIGVSYVRSTPDIQMFAGSAFNDAAISATVWFASQNIFNGASSTNYTNGGSASGNAGTGAGGGTLTIGDDGSGNYLNGKMTEAGIWNSTGFSSGQQSSMNSNQRTYWGF